MEFKVCSKCKEEFPATTEFFYKGSGKFGLRFWCKKCNKKYRKQYYQNNHEVISKCKKEYYDKNRELCLECHNKYKQTEKGKDVMRKSAKKHYENNKASSCISRRMRRSLGDNKVNRHWEDLVGYNLKQLKAHIESLFQLGMSWDNYGLHGWHIDHKIPISAFNITSYICEDFQKCWALENLQPLWAEDNLRKSNKMEEKECF
jgi:hypothetical protein